MYSSSNDDQCKSGNSDSDSENNSAKQEQAEQVELGASIFVKANHILVDAAQRFGLALDGADATIINGNDTPVAPELGIWNGRELVYIYDGQSSWWDLPKLIYTYGLAPLRTDRLVKATIARFLKLYDNDDNNDGWKPFQSLTDAAARLGLVDMTSVNGWEFLARNGIAGKFAAEFVQAGTRVNYAQNLSHIHGLETMVSMAGSGAMGVRGGNWQIFEGMLRAAGADVRLGAEVKRLERRGGGGEWEVAVLEQSVDDGRAADVVAEMFDAVVIAGPYQYAGIEISPSPQHVPEPVPYVRLHVTLFTSPYRLAPDAFGLAGDKVVPNTILTTLPSSYNAECSDQPDQPPAFFSINILQSVYSAERERYEYLYKIFSAAPVDDAFMCHILGPLHGKALVDGSCDGLDAAVTWMYTKTWNSYPYEYPRSGFEPHWLEEGLWYTGGMESFISTMETNALMGRKVAMDIVDKWDDGICDGYE